MDKTTIHDDVLDLCVKLLLERKSLEKLIAETTSSDLRQHGKDKLEDVNNLFKSCMKYLDNREKVTKK